MGRRRKFDLLVESGGHKWANVDFVSQTLSDSAQDDRPVHLTPIKCYVERFRSLASLEKVPCSPVGFNTLACEPS
ncbi:hypothetical protein COLO4_16545 [Corchorus olitorius]|uniref:Uncharacterized protein n=1 Tax=Corchorus olitorius TaxID=93759 RepID=A0A1R3JGS8_9ROSI|nr:hypothetical protein COLO4_16545 [Corchorus olitorius]